MHDVAVQCLVQKRRQGAGMDRLRDRATGARFERALEPVSLHAQSQEDDSWALALLSETFDQRDRPMEAIGFVHEHDLRTCVPDPAHCRLARAEVAEDPERAAVIQPGANRPYQHRVVRHNDDPRHGVTILETVPSSVHPRYPLLRSIMSPLCVRASVSVGGSEGLPSRYRRTGM